MSSKRRNTTATLASGSSSVAVDDDDVGVDVHVNTTTLANTQDWFHQGLVDVRKTARFGKGVFAKCDLPLPKGRTHKSANYLLPWVGSICAARAVPQAEASKYNMEAVRYVITVSDDVAYDLSTHWSGRINHAPPSRVNVRLSGTDIWQIRSIAAGEELFFEYGLGYWIYQVSHRDVSLFDEEQRKVWKRVYLITEDYGPLMRLQLYDWHPDDTISQLVAYLKLIKNHHPATTATITTTTTTASTTPNDQ
jgi:hypothetical protein